MAELTKAALETAVKSYVDASKQFGSTFTAEVDDFTHTISKIGEMVTLYLPQLDKLPELFGNDLPYGQTIEEFMVNDMLPVDYTYVDGGEIKSAPRPTFDEVVYSYPLSDKLFEVGIPYSQFQKVSLDAGAYASLASSSLATLDSSLNAWNYAAKRQLLGNLAVKASSIADLKTASNGDPAAWDETATEDFIRDVLNQVEVASDMNEHNIAQHCTAGAPSLKLYVSQKVVPTMKVKALAGAINREELALPAEVKTILDFGDQTDVIAMLVDPRGIKLKYDINEVESIAGNFVVSTKRHIKQTGFISKYGFVHIWTKN